MEGNAAFQNQKIANFILFEKKNDDAAQFQRCTAQIRLIN